METVSRCEAMLRREHAGVKLRKQRSGHNQCGAIDCPQHGTQTFVRNEYARHAERVATIKPATISRLSELFIIQTNGSRYRWLGK
jgi:hypothetical protein